MSRRSRPPRSMKVAGIRYEVQFVHGLTMDADLVAGYDGEGEVGLLGYCQSDDGVITLNEHQGADRLRETVVHEATHAMFDKTRLTQGMSGKRQEDIVGRLGPVLLAWLRDNRALIAYLQGKD